MPAPAAKPAAQPTPTHTSGPWLPQQHGNNVYICAKRIDFHGAKPSVKAIRKLKPETVVIAKFVGSGMPIGEAYANARLIAAAPDLLEALNQLVALVAEGNRLTNSEEMKGAIAALAKATGAA